MSIMTFRDELARVIANDPRYSIEAYGFTLEALTLARQQKLRGKRRDRDADVVAPPASRSPRRGSRSGKERERGHVSGRELCEALRSLALRQFGMLAWAVLAQWGVRSTSDIGEIVYNLIAAGDLEKTPEDSREDFDNVFDFETALKPQSSLMTADGDDTSP
jgi:uncharacterized repeat protein (TIGR04138 family)